MKYIISILLIAAFSFTTAAAQYGSFGVSDAQSMGMGNTHNYLQNQIRPDLLISKFWD
jgi:hypothetical protein